MDKDKLEKSLKRVLDCNNIDKLLNKIRDQYYELENTNCKLLDVIKDFNKDKEIERLMEENLKLRRNSICILSDEQTKRLNKFYSEHGHDKKITTYEFKISYTGIGEIVKIRCPVCGKEEIIADGKDL